MGLFNKKELERIAKLEKIVKKLENSNNELMNKNELLKNELDYSNVELEKYKKENEINNNTIEDLEMKKYELELDLKEANKCVNNLKEKEEYEKELDKKISENLTKIAKIQNNIEKIKEVEKDKKDEIDKLNFDIKKIKKEVNDLVELEEVGTFEINYNYEDSKGYEIRLKEIREKQKIMTSNKFNDKVFYNSCEENDVKNMAIVHYSAFTLNGNKKDGEKYRRNIDKLALRAFNNECDSIISKVKFSNVGAGVSSAWDKIKKSFETINSFIKMNDSAITEEYLQTKLDELCLRNAYLVSKEYEKEKQQRIREQMKEEERVRKEIEAEEKKVEKEEQHFMNELNKLQKRMKKENEETQAVLLKQIKELQSKLAEISEVKADLMNRRLNNKAGYVYIISNVGSFGENVYKIGTTRRLDPQIRVDELSNASVPFKFDVHAMIFSDDAFALENSLHQIFDNKRVNKVNKHKEFFTVTIDEIEKAVKENFNETVIFNKTIRNEEYLLSLGK